MAELVCRGFQVVQEDDPVLLRHRAEEARPFTSDHPSIIITTGALEDLPYDLYQPAYQINLSLHQYFPNLAYPVLQALTPDQIVKLESCQQPNQLLSRNKTIGYLLREVFGADPEILSRPHALVGWLSDYHHQLLDLPDLLRHHLVETLKGFPEYREWDVDLLIRDAQAFQGFVQQEWQKSIDQSIWDKQIRETQTEYFIPFERDPQLQDLVPGLVRRGTIQPIRIEKQTGLPTWARPGVTFVDVRIQRFSTLLEDANHQICVIKSGAQVGWNVWKELALTWAELCNMILQTHLAAHQEQKEVYLNILREIDPLFTNWLRQNYTALGAQRLPTPHHVHHIPHYLAYLRNLGRLGKVVLLVLDGLSLMDWQVVAAAWSQRHADWTIRTDLVLSQIPTITSISRYALISGLRPSDFANDIDHRVSEARAWELFWSREGIAEKACKLLPLYYDRQIDQLPELQDPRVNFWCLIDDTTDKLAHHATLGTADQQSSLKLWLDPIHHPNSLPLEAQLDAYLEQGYTLFIASDHGHVEAAGVGQPSEGLVAQTRGKRVRIYKDRLAALHVQNAFSDTILWDNDGLLPDQMAALMPEGRDAFAPNGEVVVTHGGVSIDEVIVPFIQITKESK
ncbi:hypothetical protein ADN00_13070 [Ornatilinea apprima]|uniref:Uncharacterized protein n=2 Tax=Ornatilinea apprima TaxID=1134406 RepID=A0A0P6Y1B3_9CHLR|nr:hypothetical protein ADN00_13070 [Ornatilinea apprima]